MESFDAENDDKRGQQVRMMPWYQISDIRSLFQVLSSEVQNKVVEAFEVFDHENNKTVDVREVKRLCVSAALLLHVV